MKNLFVLTILAVLSICSVQADTITLNASGATFPAPIYNRWFAEYSTAHPDVHINYQGVGSGAGIKSFTGDLTDFGASDAAMTDAEMAKVTDGGVVLLPMTAGSIVLSYNVPGVTGAIQLPRDVYPAIFLGTITKWNDPKIVAANPGVTMPDLPITVAYRADGSGTTFNFTSHLAAISADFKAKVGSGKAVKFPVGVGGKGNDGVAALIKQTPGTIGYVEYGYAMKTNLPMATLQNQAGKFVAPSPDSGSAALAQVDLPANLRAFVTDPTGDASYPMVTFTWWLCHTTYTKPGVADAIKALATWCLTDGQKLAPDLGYLPLPASVVTKVQAAVSTIK
ncbi:MAG TPA: phosphate ABC transporter substrate-binding protein PstS [Candidatus Methylacidiphilales bacterium]|jgi:phosphate transport system substrate-binding protein|nr:phosphate ABC transporter substrate-binding protein PstS [Candidatus Methylacidiphilales bacterium]